MDVIHTNRMNSLALMLENESWSQADVATEFQQIADLGFISSHPKIGVYRKKTFNFIDLTLLN